MKTTEKSTFLRVDTAVPCVREARPASIDDLSIVAVSQGYQLQARLAGSRDRWVFSSPGGLVHTATDLTLLQRFADVVLGYPSVRVLSGRGTGSTAVALAPARGSAAIFR